MPFYDENLSIILGADGTPATHISLNTKWCAFENVELSRLLKKLTSGFWKWGASEDVPFAFEWIQAAGCPGKPRTRSLEASDLSKAKPTEKSLPSEVSGCAPFA